MVSLTFSTFSFVVLAITSGDALLTNPLGKTKTNRCVLDIFYSILFRHGNSHVICGFFLPERTIVQLHPILPSPN